MEKTFITPSTKLADLIELNYRLLVVLSRLDIGLGFGEQTVEDSCNSHGINISSFLLICNEYTFDGYVPAADLLADADLTVIMKYLHNSHVNYMETGMKNLNDSLVTLMSPTDDALKKVVRKFFDDYKAEVQNHFNYEENTVFPYIHALMAGQRQEGYSIEVFEENHSDIDEKLGDLKNIVMKYLPDSCDPILRNQVLYHIFNLEEDLYHHTLIEDNILVPLVNILEENEH